MYRDPNGNANTITEESEEGVQYATRTFVEPKPFTLQAPPRAGTTPKQQQGGFGGGSSPSSAEPLSPGFAAERNLGHAEAAPGEQRYESVPIPGAYTGPLASPSHPPSQAAHGFDFGLENRK